jgi:hypothetical protein
MPATILEHQTCHLCGSTAPDVHTIGAQRLCDQCVSDCWQCVRCDYYTDQARITVYEDRICHRCACDDYTRCQLCDYYADDSDIRMTADSSYVCQGCALDAYWSCAGCGDLIDSGDCCDGCGGAPGLIEDYSYKPVPRFHGDGPGYLGLELEISVDQANLRDCAELALHRLGDLVYLKEDSSIAAGSGFELVTHPMSYRWAIERFAWDVLPALRQAGCDAYGNGLHVHISRAAFVTPSHTYRWMKFLYRNEVDVIRVARRVSTEWAAFSDYDRRSVKHYAKGDKGSRYRAINTQNDDTFELRVFASSLHPQEVQAALALTAATVEYTRALTVADIHHRHGWTWSAFVEWLNGRPQYEPLVRELGALECAC